jgi:hypothetical protein
LWTATLALSVLRGQRKLRQGNPAFKRIEDSHEVDTDHGRSFGRSITLTPFFARCFSGSSWLRRTRRSWIASTPTLDSARRSLIGRFEAGFPVGNGQHELDLAGVAVGQLPYRFTSSLAQSMFLHEVH